MSLIQRISATLTTTVDRAVGRFENHEAITAAALKDMQRAAAQARVRLGRLRRDVDRLRRRSAELEAASARWAERARATAPEDEARALACVRRRRACEAQRAELAEALERHEALEQRMAEQVERIEARVREVSRQHGLLRSRQSVAAAMHAAHQLEAPQVTGLDEAFERWEIEIGESEILYETGAGEDPLKRAFDAEETEAELRAELSVLLADEGEGSA